MASCTSSWYICVTPGSKSAVGAVHGLSDPRVRTQSMPCHGTSAGGTQGTCVSAASQLAPSEAAVDGRGRVLQLSRCSSKSSAGVREVSLDLAATLTSKHAAREMAFGRAQTCCRQP